jgi:hypothetical protein
MWHFGFRHLCLTDRPRKTLKLRNKNAVCHNFSNYNFYQLLAIGRLLVGRQKTG